MDGKHFLVAALGDDGAWTTPVRVRCARCQEFSPPFGGAGEDPRVPPTGDAPLAELTWWASNHACGPALSPDAWAAAGGAVRTALGGHGADLELDPCVKAFAAALQAVWQDVRQAAGG